MTSPANGATVSSPAHVVFSSSQPKLAYVRLFLDGQAVFFTYSSTFDGFVWMTPGTHNLAAISTDSKGAEVSSANVQLTALAAQTPVLTDQQNLPGWDSCSATFVRGTPRAGQVCAAGLGMAASSMAPGQSTPSLDGKAARFTLAGSHPYSNALWWKSLGGSTDLTHFTYDLWFFIDRPSASQALEFDVNQSFGGTRWTWGTECNFRGTGKWDLWDGARQAWVPSAVPCNPFPANTWIHLIWNFARVGSQVNYVSLEVNGVLIPVNVLHPAQPNWQMEDIDVAFQMDGDFRQDPYNVWLDRVNLMTW